METMRLRTIQQPSALEQMLEGLVCDQGLVSEDAIVIVDHRALLSILRPIVRRAVAQGSVWRAWMCSDGMRLFIAEMSIDLSRERGCPVLKVSSFNDEAELRDCSTWARVRRGHWQRIPI